jgi:hypothetical protein
MKMTGHMMRLMVPSIIWLCVGLGCKNEVVFQPEQSTVVREPNQKGCSDGTCCDKSSKLTFGYEETLVGELAVLGGPPYNSEWGLSFGRQVPRGSDPSKPNRGALICNLCHDKVEGLLISPVVIARDTTFKPDYRVWGRVYTGTNIIVIGGPPRRFVYIERIERLK